MSVTKTGATGSIPAPGLLHLSRTARQTSYFFAETPLGWSGMYVLSITPYLQITLSLPPFMLIGPSAIYEPNVR